MRLRLGCLCLLMGASSVLAAENFVLKNGDRVVFYGDSITDQRLYTVITETYVVTRYPGLNVSFVHSGWGGDKVSGGAGGPIDLRLQRDVIPYKPTVMTIMLGMNDGLYKPESEATDETFFNGYKHIVESVRTALPGIRITAIKPSPYDDVTRPPNFPGGYNEVMISFGKWIANYGEKTGLNVADLNTGEVEMLRKADALNPPEAQKILPDRVHPSFAGHMVMAEGLLTSWNARPVVAAVEIDASGANPVLKSSEHAKVSQLSGTNGIQWTELDDALPLPLAEWENSANINNPVSLVLRSSDISERLNSEPLKVTGLKSGVYSLRIDGEVVGTFNNDELARGVNLGLQETPMSKQANEVYQLTVRHCDIHNDRWRTVQVPLAKYSDLSGVQAAEQSADVLEEAVEQKRHEVGQPKPHTFVLAAVP
jgi:lysophospholipase L1-like esterase